MDKRKGIAKEKKCIRCNKNLTTDIICASCKVELINKYTSRVDWSTALEMEKFELRAARYKFEMGDE